MAQDRTHIVEAAADVLAKDFGASMQEIAAAVGIGRTTLHRAFPSREALVEAACDHVLAACARTFDEARIDDAPPAEALDRLVESAVALSRGYVLVFGEPHVYRVPRLVDEIEAQDARVQRMVERGQADGTFRPELPPRWIVYSFGSQLVGLWWAVQEGYVGERDAPRVLRATLAGGITPDAPR
jgi:TetR/AcrR family transcriptional regulator, mexCD-oprJ operon repressor